MRKSAARPAPAPAPAPVTKQRKWYGVSPKAGIRDSATGAFWTVQVGTFRTKLMSNEAFASASSHADAAIERAIKNAPISNKTLWSASTPASPAIKRRIKNAATANATAVNAAKGEKNK